MLVKGKKEDAMRDLAIDLHNKILEAESILTKIRGSTKEETQLLIDIRCGLISCTVDSAVFVGMRERS
jgi:hypothetical protein